MKEEATLKETKLDEVCSAFNISIQEKEEKCMKVFAPNRKVPVTLTNGKTTFKVDTTFDTGCSISMINSEIIAKYGLKPKPIKGYTVRDASGKVMPIDGAINLEIQLGKNRTNARFIVSPVVSETLISASDLFNMGIKLTLEDQVNSVTGNMVKTLNKAPKVRPRTKTPTVTEEYRKRMEDLLEEYKDVVRDDKIG